MQPTPKKIKPTTNQDYASIYEDNFIKTNNPAQLGQQAFTRQLSQGINNKLNPTQTGFAGIQCQEGYYFDSTKGACVPYSNEIMAYNNEVITNETRGGNTRPGFFENVGDFVGNAFQNARNQYNPNIVTNPQQPGATAPIAPTYVQVGSGSNLTPSGESIVNQYGGEYGSGSNQTPSGATASFDNAKNTIAKGVTDAMFAILGGKNKVVESVTDAAMPALQQVDQYIGGDKNFLEDVVGVTIPDSLTDKNPTTVFDDYENAFTEDTGPSLPETPTETPTVTPTGAGAQTRTGKPGRTGQDELGLANAVQTGDQTGEVLPTVNQTPPTPGAEEVGSGTVDDAQTRVSNSVQTRVDDLTNNLNQRIDQAEQFYAREYDRILNQIAMRARQSQVGGFTGGIQEQINQFASAAEIQQLNALAVERNNTLQALEAERANIPMQAQQYANELLTAELQNENIRTQALSTLYTDVLNGVRTIEEAQAFADQYGLGNIQELMTRVQTVQNQQMLLMNPNLDTNGNIVPHTIDSLRQLFPNATDAELQAMLESQNNIDIASISKESQEVAEVINDALDVYDSTRGNLLDLNGEDLNTVVGGAAGLATSLVAVGVASLAGGITAPLGAVMIVGGLIVGSLVGKGQGVGQDDVNDILKDFGKTTLFKGEGNVNSLFSGEATISISDPSATLDETTAGYGQLNDTFTVNLDGTNHKVKGHQILTLVIALKNKGVLDNYPELKQKAQDIYDTMPALDFNRIIGGVTGNIINDVFKLYRQNFE